MKNIKQYYKELGKIVYAVAIADGKINPEEITTLHEFVAKELAANENAVDSSGMNEAFYVDFEFEESIRKNLTIETAIKSYAKFIHVNTEDGDADLIKKSVMLLETIANTYTKNSEKEIVLTIKSEISEISRELLK